MNGNCESYEVPRPWRTECLLNTSWWITRGLPRGDAYTYVTFHAWLPRGIEPKLATRVETRLRRIAKEWAKKVGVGRDFYSAVSAGLYPRRDDIGGDPVAVDIDLRIYLDVPVSICDAVGLK